MQTDFHTVLKSANSCLKESLKSACALENEHVKYCTYDLHKTASRVLQCLLCYPLPFTRVLFSPFHDFFLYFS